MRDKNKLRDIFHNSSHLHRNSLTYRRYLYIWTGLLVSLTTTCFDSGISEKELGSTSQHAEFVDNTVCVECHQQQANKWRGSHHDLAMQIASETSILGDFNNTIFEHFGVKTQFSQRHGKFLVHTEGPDGTPAEFEVKYTFGVEPLQQYLIELPQGKLQCLTIAWDTKANKWFSLYPDEKIASDDPLHWTGRYQNWNLMCAECHTTDYQKGYQLETDSYRSSWTELNVSCQACHGPGKNHVIWAKNPEKIESTEEKYRLRVDFKLNKLNSRYEIESCAPCHSRRSRFSKRYPHHGSFEDHFRLQTLEEGLYFADGQIREEVYVYGSFLQSKMYGQGVSCSDCHDPHSLKLKKTGNDLCTQCHRSQRPLRDFKGIKLANYDSPSHHFHSKNRNTKLKGQGTECVSCHMPERTFMIVDPRKDHSFRVPRPDLSIKLGVPNACTQCHTDQSNQWASEKIKTWYDSPPKKIHYGEVIHSAQKRTSKAEGQLVGLIKDLDQPDIVRATALDLIKNYGRSGLDLRISSLKDKSPLVQAFSVRSFELLDSQIKLDHLGPLLNDKIRVVRMETARVLASTSPDELDQQYRDPFRTALKEFVSGQEWLGDMPASQFNLGILETIRGNLHEAENLYQLTLKMDPSFFPAYMNLGNLFNRQGRNKEAEQMFRNLTERQPEEGEGYYSLGLLIAEMGKIEEARISLAKAVQLLPNRPRVRYNYALTLQHLGIRSEAEKSLLEAHLLDPKDTDIVYALAVFYIQERNWNKALSYANKLKNLLPPNIPGPKQLIDHIESTMLEPQ